MWNTVAQKILLKREVLGQALSERVPGGQRLRAFSQYVLNNWIKNKCERVKEGVHSFLLSTHYLKGLVLDAGDAHVFLSDSIGQSVIILMD